MVAANFATTMSQLLLIFIMGVFVNDAGTLPWDLFVSFFRTRSPIYKNFFLNL